jgi:hypothetical protein
VDWNSFYRENERTVEVLAVCLLTVIVLASRAYGIWKWPLTGDEYFTVANFEDRSTGFIGSAYYRLGLVTEAIFGASKWAARLPAVILGALGIPAFYLMCKSIFNREAATIGCIFIILSEWHLYHSQIARFYSGVFVFGCLAYFFYFYALKKNSYLYLVLFFVFSGIAVSFHLTSIFIIPSCMACSILLVAWGKRVDLGLSPRIARAHMLVCVIGALVVSPKLVGIASSLGVTYTGIQAGALSPVLGAVENMEVVIFVSAAVGLAYLYFEDAEMSYLMAVLSGIPMIMLLLFYIFISQSKPRYMFYSLPLFFSLSAYACTRLRGNIKWYTGLRNATYIIISSVLLVNFASYYSGRLSLSVEDPIHFVEENYQSGDRVVVFGYSVMRNFDGGINAKWVKSKSIWERGLVPIAKKEGRTWIIVDTYRTAPLRQDLEAWLFENASLKWRKEETRFDYTQRGYEVWLENDQCCPSSATEVRTPDPADSDE